MSSLAERPILGDDSTEYCFVANYKQTMQPCRKRIRSLYT